MFDETPNEVEIYRRYRKKTKQINVFFSIRNHDVLEWLASEYGTNGNAVITALRELRETKQK